jgi:hypothetical protein
MKAQSKLSASRAFLSMPAGSFLRHNPITSELELVGFDGMPLAVEIQQSFFSGLPEVTIATLRVSILDCF